MHLLAREEAGLRCLLQVALSELAESLPAPLPIAQIAAAEGLSDVYAAKLMRQLRLAGLVESSLLLRSFASDRNGGVARFAF